jgi:hypothetical protein
MQKKGGFQSNQPKWKGQSNNAPQGWQGFRNSRTEQNISISNNMVHLPLK